MAAASAGLHESSDALKPGTVDRHRAIVSLMEELEAVDWYDQRIDAAQDADLRAILVHNRDEEKEHAAMLLEWLRRHDAPLDEQLHAYLFSGRPVVAVEESKDSDAAAPAADGSLGIGSLRAEVRA
jgi:ferritin-like protein